MDAGAVSKGGSGQCDTTATGLPDNTRTHTMVEAISTLYLAGCGKLFVTDRQSQLDRYSGRILNQAVIDAWTLPGTDDGVVLLDRMDASRTGSSGLVRVRNDGSVVWQAERAGPTNADCYVSMCVPDCSLVAWTWGCRFVELDPETGLIVNEIVTG